VSVNKRIHIRRQISQRQVSWEKYLLQPSGLMAKIGALDTPCRERKLFVFK